MFNHQRTKTLKKFLKQCPGEAFIIPDGSALAVLASPKGDVIVITAPRGKNFNDMTDEEVNGAMEAALKK